MATLYSAKEMEGEAAELYGWRTIAACVWHSVICVFLVSVYSGALLTF